MAFSIVLAADVDSSRLFLEVQRNDLSPRGETPEQALARRTVAAKNVPESRPADLDSDGNWGPLTEGVQVSIRFDKTEYTVGDPIRPRVVLRNVSAKTLRVTGSHRVDQLKLTAIDEEGRAVPRSLLSGGPVSITGGASGFFPVSAGEQFTYGDLEMKHFLSLTNPGVYFVTAWLGQAGPSSGNAMIRILAPDQALDTTNVDSAVALKPGLLPPTSGKNASLQNLGTAFPATISTRPDVRSSKTRSAPPSGNPYPSQPASSSTGQVAVSTPTSAMTRQDRLGIGIIAAVLAAIAFILLRRRNPGRTP